MKIGQSRRAVRTLLAAAFFAGLLLQTAAAAESLDAFQTKLRPLLDRYCVECHMEGSAEGGVAFDRYDDQHQALEGGRVWLQVLDALEGRIMPPVDMPQPAVAEFTEAIDWIENDFYSELCSEGTRSRPVVIRRLNRHEYQNTIRDLLRIDSQLADDFPHDDIAFGFDNIGSALNISPIHIEKYLMTAERTVEEAITAPNAEGRSPIELIGLQTHRLPPTEAVEFEHTLAPGRYFADFSLVRVGVPESVTPPRLVIGFGKDRRTVQATHWQDETVVYRFWLTVAAGDKLVHVHLAPQEREREDLTKPVEATAITSGDQRYGNDLGLHVDSIVVRGPVEFSYETLSAAQREIVFCQPDFGDQSRLDCGRQVITRFTERAFRRPVAAEEIARVMDMFRLAHERGESFERAIQVALTTVLIAPEFLYLVEPEEASEDRLLNEFELASRLSYFLWSSMPDGKLLAAARQGTLRSNLRQQIDQMLDDSKSAAFVRNFTGQWLLLRKLEDISKDEDMFPTFDTALRDGMREETEQFFGHILRQNRSALELLDADYTYLNEPLADHYGIAGVSGAEFQRVNLDSRRRGGLLTQASVLTLTSNPNRTSPVKRGQWILQQLLGTPPPPPPPDVAALDESPEAAEVASLRERLEVHRKNPECAACHNQMDPLGFALENYDAIGRWRTTDGEFEIDPSGTLVGGRSFNDVTELKELLQRTASKKFSRCLVEAMLTYALGRGLELYDQCTVEVIREQLVDERYQIRHIIYGIAESKAFQYRGVAE